MANGLNRRLFLENGPTLFADSDRAARTTSDAYRILRQAKRSTAANCNAANRTAAA